MLWNVDLKASRDIPGDIRTFARKLVMGSVDLLPFAEREDLRNNSCLLVLLNSLCVFRWTCVTLDINPVYHKFLLEEYIAVYGGK